MYEKLIETNMNDCELNVNVILSGMFSESIAFQEAATTLHGKFVLGMAVGKAAQAM